MRLVSTNKFDGISALFFVVVIDGAVRQRVLHCYDHPDFKRKGGMGVILFISFESVDFRTRGAIVFKEF